MNPWLLILMGWLAMVVVMAVCWMIQRYTHDAGIVDVAWGLGVALIAVGFCWASEGDPWRRILTAVLVSVWAVRLSGYIFYRLLTQPEDGRYQQLKQQWGADAQRRLFFFYQKQALASVLFAVPMLLAAQNQNALGGWDYLGAAIWIIAMGGEILADYQLHRFRAQRANQGQVCQDGLWRYSRHPNYFFEWLLWWAYVPLAIFAPWGWLAILAPLAMFYFITQITGIPPTEEQSLRSRGDAYRRYQQTTNAFFPWFPQKG